jgi:hypothetical protein
MDAQSQTKEAAVRATAMEARAIEPAVRDSVDLMELLDLNDLEAALHDTDFASLDLEESVRTALAEIAVASGTGTDAANQAVEPGTEVTAAVTENGVAKSLDTIELELALDHAENESAGEEEPSPASLTEALGAAETVAGPTGGSAAPIIVDDAAAGESLETVEFELALQNQNLVSLGFEESIRTALEGVGGEVLFQMRLEEQDCQRVAAVRIGTGEEQEFALVIMPPGGGIMRVEPVKQSNNPLAKIAESYAGLVDVFRAAA